MKKALKLVCVLLLSAFLLGGLASCAQVRLRQMDETDRAFELYDRVFMGEMPRGVRSYTVSVTMSMQMTVQGFDANITANGDMHYTNDEVCEKLTLKSVVAGETTETETLAGYTDGTMFRSQRVDGKYLQRLKSPITKKEYQDFRAESAMGLEFEPSEYAYCAMVTCVENDDGWKATYTDFYESGMEPYRKMFAGYDELLAESFRLVDMEVTLLVDGKLCPKQVKMIPIYEKKDANSKGTLPTIAFEFKFVDYNQTSQTNLPDLGDYAEVADLRVLDRVEDAIEERLDAESGKFKTVISAESRVDANKSKSTESYDVSYSTTDGKLSYTMEFETYTGSSSLNKSRYRLTYADSQLKTLDLSNFREQKSGTNDDAQRKTLKQLMNYIPLDTGSVAGIVEDENESGLYTFTAEIKNLDAYQSLADSIDADNLAGTVTYTVKLVDGKITRFEVLQIITASTEDHSCSVEITASCVFSD